MGRPRQPGPGHREPRLRPWITGALVAAACVLPGCASRSECVNTEFERPFGRRFVKFFSLVGSVPGAVAEDWSLRRKNLGREFDGIGAQWRREVAKTAAHPFPDLIGDAREHWPQLTASLGYAGATVVEDFRCAVPRLWHELKLLE